MKRRTLFQVLGGILAGLSSRFEPVREVVARAKARFSPIARWRHVKPETVVSATLKGDEAFVASAKGWPVKQYGLKVAEVLNPPRVRTRLGNDDEYLAALLRADGVEDVRGANVQEVIANNSRAMEEAERPRYVPDLDEVWRHPSSKRV